MSYNIDQYDARFSFIKGKEEEARQAVVAANIGFNESDSLERMFDELNWDYEPNEGQSDCLHRSDSYLSDLTDKFFDAIAPFVADGSYIVAVGEDMAIWRWFFKNGKCEMQDGKVTFGE